VYVAVRVCGEGDLSLALLFHVAPTCPVAKATAAGFARSLGGGDDPKAHAYLDGELYRSTMLLPHPAPAQVSKRLWVSAKGVRFNLGRGRLRADREGGAELVAWSREDSLSDELAAVGGDVEQLVLIDTVAAGSVVHGLVPVQLASVAATPPAVALDILVRRAEEVNILVGLIHKVH
jgi:hypothetical protein